MTYCCDNCLHRYICSTALYSQIHRPGECTEWLLDRTTISTERAFYDELKKHLYSYDLPNYHQFNAIDEETLDDIAKEFGII